MAYISKETTAKIRKALKKEFSEIKFSVKKYHDMKVEVLILKAPEFAELNGQTHYSKMVNDMNFEKLESEAQKSIFRKILSVILTEGNHYDNSDIQTDYFDTAFYYSVKAATA